MKKLITFLLLTLPALGAYENVRPIIIPHAHVAANLTGFPMTVAGKYPYLATVANGGAVQSASGYDIVFTGDSGCSSLLNFERVFWNATSGQSEFHVEIPALSQSSDTTIYLCYGNSAITSDQQSTATWDPNFIGVWHLPNGSTLAMTDSTSHGNNGTTSSATAGMGQIDGAALFNGSGGINMGQTPSLQSPGTAVTVSAWANVLNASPNSVSVIAAQTYSNPNAAPYWSYYLSNNDPSCPANNFAAAWAIGTTLKVVCSGVQWFPGKWYYVAFTFDGANGTMFINGKQTAQVAGPGTLSYSNGGFDIGSDPANAVDFKGAIDEVRVSNIARSADWIATEYANQSDPNAFFIIGQPLANSSNFSGVSVVGTTNTQAIIRFTYAPGNVASCTVAVSRNPSLYPLVNDVNPALFVTANLVSRDSANLINGTTAQIVVGKRYKAFYAADGNRYSRALKQNASYYYGLNCAGDSFSGSFSTRPLAMGDTHLDGIPPDSNNPGAPAWPSPTGFNRCNTADTNCTTARRDTDYIDPQTGVLIKHLVMPDDNVLADNNSQAGLATGTGWTIPSGWATSTTSRAVITASTNPIAIGVWNNNAFKWGDVISSSDYYTPVMMQFSITANLTNSACTGTNNAPDCRMDVCVTLNWQTCAPNAQIYQQPLSATPTQYTFGSGQMYDVMQQSGKRIWAQFETGWRGGDVTCDGSNTVTKIWDTGTFPPESNPVGSYVWIYPIGNQLVTGNIDALHFTIDTACPNSSASSGPPQGSVSGHWYVGGSAFGILVWKETRSSDTLALSNEFLDDLAGGDNDPQYNSGFYGAPMTVTSGNGDPGGVLQLRQGGYSIDLLSGKVGAFMPPSPTTSGSTAILGSGFDNGGNLWVFNSDRSLTKYVYQGDWATAADKVGHPEMPLWQGWGEVALPTCTAPSQDQCFQSPVTITQPGQTLDVLLTAFDSRYSLNPFGQWYFVDVEMGKMYFDIRWTNAPAQNYWGWVMIFDPLTTSNVNGLFGAGCVGQNTNPAGENYLTPGCIVAARRVSDYPRWMTQKGPAAMLRDGWTAQQESIYAFGSAGGGPAVANKNSSLTALACPSNSYGYTACVRFSVDGDPYDFLAGSGSRGVLGSYAVGDYAMLGVDDITYPGGPVLDQPDIDLLQLLQINGTTLTFACVYGSSYCAPGDTNPQMLWMYSSWPGFNYPWSPMADLLMWNYASDPHGQNIGGNTIVWDYSTYNAHGFSANSLFSQGGTWSAKCVANQSCYNNQNFQALTDSAFAASVMQQTRENVTGLVAMSSYFAGHQGFNGACGNDNCQTHPDYSKLGSEPVSNYGVDFRPYVGIGGLPNTSDVSLVTGTLYKIANISSTLHPKVFDTQGTSARRVLRNVSGPGSVIASDSSGYYTMCQALLANECQAGSSAGDFFVNIPYLLTYIPGSQAGSACYFPPGGFATNTSDNWTINDVCIYDAGMEAQSGTRYSLASFDYVGGSEQTFGHLFNNGRSSIFSAIHPATNITSSTYSQWYYFPAQFWDGVFSTMLLESPPISIDSAVRTTFQPVIVNVAPIPGSDGVGVEFGYAEYGPDGAGGFECSPNRSNDPCMALSSTINEATPFYWESEGHTPASSGPIAIPGLPEHVVYYRPVYYLGSTIVGRGPIQAAPIR